MALHIAFYTTTTILQFVFASPKPGETIGQHLQNARKDKTVALSTPLASAGVIIDLYIFVLPIAAISKIQLPTRRKIGITIVFMTGAM